MELKDFFVMLTPRKKEDEQSDCECIFHDPFYLKK